MKKHLILVVVLFGSTLFASQEIANEQGCMECHAIYGAKLAPGFMGASKHALATANPKEYLVNIIKEGSSGTRRKFIDQVMPAYEHLDAKTIEELADWILSLSSIKKR